MATKGNELFFLGKEVCHDKNLESTVQKPEEVCDLQPSSHCRLVTNLVPHLESQTVCKDIPKEICHLKLDHPKMVKKPVKLKWCTRAPQEEQNKYPAYPQPVHGGYSAQAPPAPAARTYGYRPAGEEPAANAYQQPEAPAAEPPRPNYG